MSSEQNQKKHLDVLRELYESLQLESTGLENALNLMQKAKTVYAEFIQGQKKNHFSVYQVHDNVKDTRLETLKSLEFDWKKFYQES